MAYLGGVRCRGCAVQHLYKILVHGVSVFKDKVAEGQGDMIDCEERKEDCLIKFCQQNIRGGTRFTPDHFTCWFSGKELMDVHKMTGVKRRSNYHCAKSFLSEE